MILRSELEAMRKASLLFMFSGITALVGAVWLSGRSFERARVRAALALALFLAPMFGLFATAGGQARGSRQAIGKAWRVNRPSVLNENSGRRRVAGSGQERSNVTGRLWHAKWDATAPTVRS